MSPPSSIRARSANENATPRQASRSLRRSRFSLRQASVRSDSRRSEVASRSPFEVRFVTLHGSHSGCLWVGFGTGKDRNETGFRRLERNCFPFRSRFLKPRFPKLARDRGEAFMDQASASDAVAALNARAIAMGWGMRCYEDLDFVEPELNAFRDVWRARAGK